MADLVTGNEKIQVVRRYAYMGVGADGKESYAEVVALGADPSIDLGDVQIKPPADVTLLPAASAVTGAWVPVISGRYNWITYGVYGGATAQLQFSPDAGVSTINLAGATNSAPDNDFMNISFGNGHARVLLTSPGGTTSLTSKLFGVP